MSKFGWSYPPGAAGDPYAPYNMQEQPSNDVVEQAFSDYDGPYDLYRNTYKYTACGPSIGFQFFWVSEEPIGEGPCAGECFEKERSDWVYCDSLRQWGTWKDLRDKGILVTGVSVSSIVEGVDETTETVHIDIDPLDYERESADVAKVYWDAVEDVNRQAAEIWNATHGCDKCREHWVAEYGGDGEVDGAVPVWDECPECDGAGMVI